MKKIYALLMLTLPLLGFAQNTHVVTFKVNAANITVGPNGVYAGGGVIGGSDAVALSDPDGDGIWEGTDTLDGTAGGNFIFLNSPTGSSDWGTKENLNGLPCADPANYDDRIMPTFGQDTTLEFCFGTCAPSTVCPPPPPPPPLVTFIVDMTEYTGTYTTVYVNGTFNGWCGTCNPMTDPDGDSVWTVALPIDTGAIEWKFTLDGWTAQENFTAGTSCTVTNGGFTNRGGNVTGDEIFKGVCFNECYSCDTNEVYATFQVNMKNQTVDTTGLFVGGGAGMGGPTDNMLENIAGTEMWTATFVKPVGFHSDYIFLNGFNSGWGTKENLAGLPCAYGQWNDRTTDTMLTDWSIRTCYEVCSTDGLCPVPPVQQSIHFVVDMNASYAPTFTQPYVSGNFNSWSGDAMPMTEIMVGMVGTNVWEYTAMIDENTSLEYKFTLDNWANQEQFDTINHTACTQDFGGFVNRVYTVGSTGDTLTYCFNSCASNCASSIGMGEEELNFTVMPNPANDVLNIIGRSSEKMTVEVISLNGRTMMNESTQSGSVKLNVSFLPRALYLVHITQGDIHQYSRVSLN